MNSVKEEKHDKYEIKNIMMIEGNERCVDCGSDDPQYASMNNAVFVCLNCAGYHRNLGESISLIKSLTKDHFNDMSLKMLYLGGNVRFIQNLEDFHLIQNNNHLSLDEEKIISKYMYKASDYYRQILLSELGVGDIPERPDNDTACEFIFSSSNDESNINHIDKDEKKEKKGFLGKVGGFFSGLGKDISSGYKKVEEKVKKVEIKKGFQNTYDKTKQLAKETGIFFSNKAQQIKVSYYLKRILKLHKKLETKCHHYSIRLKMFLKRMNQENQQVIIFLKDIYYFLN